MLESPASRLKPAIKERWVAALRSGEYTQGQGSLRILDSYCCLGVLADLAVKDSRGSWDERGDFISRDDAAQRYRCPPRFQDFFEYLDDSNRFSDGTISPQANKADLFVRLPELARKCGISCEGKAHGIIGLMELNDEQEFSFNEIADVIEVCL